MSFLNEGTFIGKNAVADALKDPEFKALKSDEKAKAIATLKQGGSITTEIEEANAYLAAADAARDAGKKEFEFPEGSGKMHKVTLKRDLDLEEGKLSKALGGVAVLAGLLLMNKINSNDPVIQRLQAEYEQADPAQQDSIQKLMTKRLIFLDSGDFDSETPMDEAKGGEYNPPEYTIFEPARGEKGRFRSAVGYKPLKSPTDTVGDFKQFTKKAAKVAGKRFDKGFAKFVGVEYDTPFSDLVDDLERVFKDNPDNTELQKFAKKLSNIEDMSKDEFNSFIKELGKEGYDKKELQKLQDRYKKAQQAKTSKNKKAVKEEKELKLPADTTFTIDLKHLMQKHGKEDTIKLTKKLMQQLHDKGKVEVDGTTLVFEMNMMQDTPLALPKAPARNYLGDDGKDYEGGMAKSQMLKMKKYATALCDMVDDETQLEAWVQAKITKASDYMSAVYHYLDYQKSKMDENLNPSMMDTDEILVSILMSVARLGEESAEQVVDNLTAEDFKKAAMMMMRDVDEREIAKFILSATKLDESSKINENRLVPKDEWEQLDIEWEMPNPDENRLDYQAGVLIGTTDDGREFESYGYYTEFEGLVIDDDVYEV